MGNSVSNQTESIHNSDFAKARLKKRYGKERRFRMWGVAAISFALLSLGWLLFSLAGTGFTAFHQNFMTLEVKLEQSVIDPQNTRDREKLRGANYRRIIQNTMYAQYPEVTERKAKQELFALVSASGATNQIRQMVYADPSLIGKTSAIYKPR